jgi:integrase
MKLLSLPNKNTFSGLRDYCLILLTLDTGIRPKEALNLLPADINLSSLEITVRKEIAKTKSSRTLPISPITALHLQKLIRVRPSNWNDDVPIFCSYNGQPMLETSWGHKLKKYSKKLNFSITPYSLRHCFALYYLRSGGNVFTLQRTMRHSDLNMTKRYLALTTDDLKKQHQLASPVNLFTQKD